MDKFHFDLLFTRVTKKTNSNHQIQQSHRLETKISSLYLTPSYHFNWPSKILTNFPNPITQLDSTLAHIMNDNNYVIILYCVGMRVFGEWKYILIVFFFLVVVVVQIAIYL